MFVATEKFIAGLTKVYDKHSSVSTTDGERTWYPHQACRFLKLMHHIHSFFEKKYQYRKDNAIYQR